MAAPPNQNHTLVVLQGGRVFSDSGLVCRGIHLYYFDYYLYYYYIQCDENLRATVLYDLPPSYLVTAGVDQLLEHLPVDLAGPGRVGRSRGRARLVGERH